MFLKLILVLNPVILYELSSAIATESAFDLGVLNRNLLESLKLHPRLNVEGNLTERENDFIDKYINDYFELTDANSEIQLNGRLKRSLNTPKSYPEDGFGTHIFSGIRLLNDVPIHNASNFEYFQLSNKSYLATMEDVAFGTHKLGFKNLLIFGIQNNTYSRSPEWKVQTAEQFSIHTTSESTYIIVRASDQYYSGVWVFDGIKLEHVQNMDMENVTDMRIWETETELHMAISGMGYRDQPLNLNETKNYNKTSVYKWTENFFNLVQVLDRRADRILPFVVEGNSFLLIRDGNTSRGEYSEIYRRNLDNGLFEIHQRIPTYNCRDVKFFKMNNLNGYDSYLIVANYVYGEDEDSGYEIPPIIYKYVNGYFLPFQNLYIEHVLEFQTFYNAEDSVFLLLARTEYQGLKTYQYDGWLFQETPHDINVDLDETEISKAKFAALENNKTVLVLGFDKRKELELYTIDFVHKNDISDFREETLKWCQTSTDKLTGESRHKRQVESGDNAEEKKIDTTNDDLIEKINSADSLLEQLEQQTANSLQYEGPHIVQDLTAETIVMKDPFIRQLSTSTLNNDPIDPILNNLIQINEDNAWPDHLILERTHIDSQIHPENFNGRSIEDVITSKDNLSINKLTITGKTTFSAPSITESLNGIPFDVEHIVMKEGDQSFRDLDVDGVRVDKLDVGKVNGRSRKRKEGAGVISKISKLKAYSVEVGGLINDVSIKFLDKYALKTSGDQVLTGKYHFEDLRVGNMDGEVLSNENLDDLIRINSGLFKLNANLNFYKPLSINNLTVTTSLDVIPVSRGKLQVLLKDVEDVQEIKGEKLMSDVEILSPIKLQGNIKGFAVDKYNPVVHVEGPFIYEGDFEIRGDTSIEKLLLTKDLRSADGDRSVKRVLSRGLPLRSKEIDVRLDFNQQLDVDEVLVDTINGADPDKWVVTGTDEPQVIRGPKIFSGDVDLTGNTNFTKINNILVSDLDERVLWKTGDQVITGKHTIVNVVASRVFGNNTFIGNNSWKNILTPHTKQMVLGTTVFNEDVEANFTIAKFSNVKGAVNGYNFTKIASDTVTTPNSKTVTGLKTFKNLEANDLGVAMADLSKKRKITVDGDVRLETARVENVHFAKKCNEIDGATFGSRLEEDTERTVSDLSSFDDLVVLGNVFVESNFLGDLDIGAFERDTVKIDEAHAFGAVVFDNALVSGGTVKLHGDIERVDLENVVLSNSKDVLKISGYKTFLNDLNVTGTAVLEGTVNEFEMTGMCEFSDAGTDKKEMEIFGNAVFVKGPQVHNILNETVKTIHETAWLRNREASFEQEVSLENVTFRSNVTVNGTVDGVDLEVLDQNYFSKTKDQTITGGLYFANNVLFRKNLICPSVAMNGEVNGLKIQELPRTVLLRDMDQVFEEIAYFENIVVDDLRGKFTVNNSSLETDLMRHDSDNVVTGKKRLNRLVAADVDLKPDATVQNVDVLSWLQNAVLKTGAHAVEKRKIIKGDARLDLSLVLLGTLNGEPFTNETIMLKSAPQRVTGVKTFELEHLEVMRMRNVKLRGLLNQMQVSDLLEDQSATGDMILKSPMHFCSDIYTKNINLRKPFGSLDLDAFIADLDNLENTNLVEKYAELLNITVRLNRNLQVQAFYLQSYKELQEIENPQFIMNSCCGSPTLVYFDYVNGSYVLDYYYWDQDFEKFQKSVHLAVDMGYPPVKTEVFSLDRQQFLYMEYPTEENGPEGLFRGQFWKVESLRRLVEFGSITSNGIRQITPLNVEGSYCILIVYENLKSPHIYCEFNLGHMRLLQALPQGKYVQSEHLNIDGTSFLILLNAREENMGTSQAGVEIWCLHGSQFGVRQVLYFSDPPPKSISAVSYRGYHYLSIVYRGGIQQGHIDILRYSKSSGNFEQWQKITSNNQVKAEFSILPSGELFFFVLGPSNETLTIYKYVGVSGFRQEITIPSSQDITDFKQFALGKKHFVMINTLDKLKILQAQFKGSTEESL